MKVRELVALLKKEDQNAEAKVFDGRDWWSIDGLDRVPAIEGEDEPARVDIEVYMAEEDTP